MKLVMTLLVRDEADIIRQNIEFHLAQGVDEIVAIDNGSVDGTRELLDSYQRAGVATVFDEPEQTFAQSRWVTRAALYARDTLGATWVLNNDADEFWVPRAGALKEVLAEAKGHQLDCARRNMIAPWDMLRGPVTLQELVYHVADPQSLSARPADIYHGSLPCPYFYLALPPKALLRAEGLRQVAQGNHSGIYEAKAPPEIAPINIYHFPVRSLAQFEKKIDQGGQAYAANAELPETMGWHWRRWYRMYKTSGLETALADALPDASQVQRDLAAGVLLEDRWVTRLGDML